MRQGYLYRRSPNAGMLTICFLAALCILGSTATFFCVGFCGVGKAEAQTPINKGDKVGLVSNQYVRVVNPDKVVHKRRGAILYGERCFVSAGGSVTVVGTHKSHVLLRYSTPPKDSGDCPNLTLFFMSQKDYRKMLRDIAAHNARIQGEKDLVKRLLKEEKKLPIKRTL